MKKSLCIILIVSLLLSIFATVSFATVDPNIVARYIFSNGTESWTTFGTSNTLVHNEDGYISLSNEGKSWVSPAINIYDTIKANGAGTYTVNAKVMLEFDPQANVTARMILRTDKSYSFTTSQASGYYSGIGIKTEFEPYTWSNLSGSFKVLPSDIIDETGQFLLCFDELFCEEVSDFCVDNVRICKLDNTDITNGDFYHSELGWRNWGGLGNFEIDYTGINISGLCSRYIKASTYGSIATNVDQIITNYGCTKYDLSFKLKIEADAYENLDKFVIYLSKNNGEYNYWVSTVQKSSLDDEIWLTVNATVDMSTVISGENTLYDTLAPQTNQVFLRFEFRNLDGTTYQDDLSYLITDVSFKLKPYASFIYFADSILSVKRGWCGKVSCFVGGNEFAADAIRWESSNENIFTVDSASGSIVTKNTGTALLKAISKDDESIYSTCEITVTPCKQAVILLHGRIDDTGDIFGAHSNISGKNNEFEASITAKSENNLYYTSVDAQKIVTILNTSDENDNTIIEDGNLAYYLTETLGYEKNVNLFAFNYPNEDAVIHSAMKFKTYIDNLIAYVRNSNDTALKYAFYENSEAYANNEYTFNIVGHSMGGLVARYYIENCTNVDHYNDNSHESGACQYNDNHVTKLITMNTPHWGSTLANSSCGGALVDVFGANLHRLCDHDLHTDSRMYGGLLDVPCNLVCTFQNAMTDMLNYQRPRTTRYYAIGGFNASFGTQDIIKEIDVNLNSYDELANEIEAKFNCWTTPETLGDNVVGIASQIGLSGSLFSSLKIINFEKIAINVDANDGNNIFDHLHSKMAHRSHVMEKIGEFLWD